MKLLMIVCLSVLIFQVNVITSYLNILSPEYQHEAPHDSMPVRANIPGKCYHQLLPKISPSNFKLYSPYMHCIPNRHIL